MASPERETGIRFSASLRVSRPGETTSSIPPTGPAPIEPGGSGAAAAIVWTAFRIGVWAACAVWMVPGLLDYVGGHALGQWIGHNFWVRALSAPPLAIMAFISVLQPMDDPKRTAAREDLAMRSGGTVYRMHGFDSSLGLADGPGVRIPLGGWTMDVANWKHQGTARSVATVVLESRSPLMFAVRGSRSEPPLLRGLQQTAMQMAARRMLEQAQDPRAAAVAAELAFLGQPPVSVGVEALDGLVVLRSNQPDAARALLASSGVASAIGAMDQRLRMWSWTLNPARQDGFAEMRFEAPGVLGDEEALRLVQTLVRAALEHLASAGIIAPGS